MHTLEHTFVKLKKFWIKYSIPIDKVGFKWYNVFIGTKPMKNINLRRNTMYAYINSGYNRIMCCCISSRTREMAYGCSGIVVIKP